MKIKKFAAVDIGSNAIRMLVSNVLEREKKPPLFTKNALIRLPIRLGQDSFTVGEISKKNRQRLVEAMKAFKLLMEIHEVEDYMACATSALREANNGQKVVEKIEKETKVAIQIIDGRREAEIIASSELFGLIQDNNTYLYVDVGGGSTEFTVFSGGKIINSKSFKIGTVRMLNEMVPDAVWEKMKNWILKHTKSFQKISVIGSGGNINKLHKLAGKKYGVPLSYSTLNEQYQRLSKMSFDDMVFELRLNPDRADVIVPATRVYLMAMKFSKSTKIYVPKVGLADGMIKTIYYERHQP